MELLATSVASFTVKHFVLEQENTLKQFTLQIKQEGLMIDDKSNLVHKYLQYFQQKLLTRSSWGSTGKHRTTVLTIQRIRLML